MTRKKGRPTPLRKRSQFDVFCAEAFTFLEAAKVPNIVIGGLAVAIVGDPRLTADVDVVAFIAVERAADLVERAIEFGFEVSRAIENERVHTTGTLRFRKGPFQLDIILASLPFEDSALARSVKKRLFGKRVSLPTPEDLILFKVLAGRDKDLLDAEGVARRHAASLDRRYLEDTLRPICDLAEDMTPWRRLEDVLRKAGITH